jgi:hypothetical protein
MSRHRKGELGTVPFRSGRFFYIDNKWYFSCREGKEKGPYDSKQEAEKVLLAYIEQTQKLEEPQQHEENPSPSFQPPLLS